jgi:hypothetical protein
VAVGGVPVGVAVGVAVGVPGVSVGVDVGTVPVGVAVPGVSVGVAVAGVPVFVGVAVAGVPVFVGVAVKVGVAVPGVLVKVGGVSGGGVGIVPETASARGTPSGVMLGFAYAATATALLAVAPRVNARRLIRRAVSALSVRSTTASASLAAGERRAVTPSSPRPA